MNFWNKITTSEIDAVNFTALERILMAFIVPAIFVGLLIWWIFFLCDPKNEIDIIIAHIEKIKREFSEEAENSHE